MRADTTCDRFRCGGSELQPRPDPLQAPQDPGIDSARTLGGLPGRPRRKVPHSGSLRGRPMLTHSARFKREALDHITGSSGDGRIHTYIHKVPFALLFRGPLTFTLTVPVKVYPWTEIQEAHREMQADKNRYAVFRSRSQYEPV